MLAPWKKNYDKPRENRHYFADKGPYSQSCGFPSSHVQMWELNHKESWALKNWCFWIVVLEKTLESSLDSKEIQPVHPKGNQSWIFIGRTDAKGETPIFWPPDVTSRLIRKDQNAGKDWSQEEKRMSEDEMVGWHWWLNGHEFEQALGDGEGQGSLRHDWATEQQQLWLAVSALTAGVLDLTPGQGTKIPTSSEVWPKYKTKHKTSKNHLRSTVLSEVDFLLSLMKTRGK